MRDTSIEGQAWDTSISNNWSRPASLNTYLNGTYYNSLTSTAKSQIVSSNYSIGAVTWDNNNLFNQIRDENGTTWNGKVALITASEYIRSNSNTSRCESLSLNDDNIDTCRSTTWMYPSGNWWILSPYASSTTTVLFISHGMISNMHLGNHYEYVSRPVVTLSSEIQITGGTGTQSDLYTIE